MFWKEQPIHVIDFEGSPRYGVVEYGVVTLLGGQIVQTSTALCAPDTEMTAKEIALHGIRTRDTAGTAPFAEHRELFFALRKTGCLCAHHASVENGFLKRTWAFPPLSDNFATPLAVSPQSAAPAPAPAPANAQATDLPETANRSETALPHAANPPETALPQATTLSKLSQAASPPETVPAQATANAATYRQIADWGPWVDTRALYAAIYPGLESYSLGELVKTFALGQLLTERAATYCPPSRRKAHCALFDALASALLLLHLGAEDGFQQLPLHWLIEHSAASAETRDERRQQELF